MFFKKKSTITQIMFGEAPSIKVPNRISFNTIWELNLNCASCKQAFSLNQKDFVYINSLSNRYINNIFLVKQIGELLDLKKTVSANNPKIFYYSLNYNYFGSSSVSYCQCPKCKAQYFIAFHEFLKDERDIFPNEIYIEKILHVEFDHEEFMAELKKG